VVICPYCELSSLVQGERGIRRWQVSRQVDRETAQQAVIRFFSGIKKARDLRKSAQIRDLFLIYLPYWRVQSFVAGWMFGRVKSGNDGTRPVEVELLEEMHWNDAAVDVAEYGVHRVTLSREQLEPFDNERLHSEAMVFEPAESPTDAMQEAHQHFTHRGRSKRSLKSRFFERFHFLRERLSIVYYPLWVARYEYHKRNYQVVVDGVTGQQLYGKAPGNIIYRAAALVAGLAFGNFVLVNGTIIAATIIGSSSDQDGAWLILLPILLGIGLIAAGYSAFRYGEEVEELDRSSRKAETSGGTVSRIPLVGSGSKEVDDLLRTGLSFLEDIAEKAQ
jgi:hypothetical protein